MRPSRARMVAGSVIATLVVATMAWAQSGGGSTRGIRGEWFMGWGTLALVNAGLAQSKNRGGAVWFLVSLLLGPIATFLIVATSPVPRPTPPA